MRSAHNRKTCDSAGIVSFGSGQLGLSGTTSLMPGNFPTCKNCLASAVMAKALQMLDIRCDAFDTIIFQFDALGNGADANADTLHGSPRFTNHVPN